MVSFGNGVVMENRGYGVSGVECLMVVMVEEKGVKEGDESGW